MCSCSLGCAPGRAAPPGQPTERRRPRRVLQNRRPFGGVALAPPARLARPSGGAATKPDQRLIRAAVVWQNRGRRTHATCRTVTAGAFYRPPSHRFSIAASASPWLDQSLAVRGPDDVFDHGPTSCSSTDILGARSSRSRKRPPQLAHRDRARPTSSSPDGMLARFTHAQAPSGAKCVLRLQRRAGAKVPWQTALGAVFVVGVLFTLLSHQDPSGAFAQPAAQLEVRHDRWGRAVPAFIGLRKAGLGMVADPQTLVTLGSLRQATPGLSLGLYVTVMLQIAAGAGGDPHQDCRDHGACDRHRRRRVSGVGMSSCGSRRAWRLAVAAAGVPKIYFWRSISKGRFRLPSRVLFTMLFVAIDDTAGTLVGLSAQAGFTRSRWRTAAPAVRLQAMRSRRAHRRRAVWQQPPHYIESAAGIEEGGRTGLVAVVDQPALFLVARTPGRCSRWFRAWRPRQR